MSKVVPSHLLTGVLQTICRKVNSPTSLKVFLLIKYGEYDQLFNLKIDPNSYSDWRCFKADNICVEFLRKLCLSDSKSKRVRRSKAVDSFWESEHSCANTNVRFNRLINNHSLNDIDLRALEFLERAKNWIASVLGPVPNDLKGRFGPGSTYHDRGKLTTIPDKMTSGLCYTKGLRPLLTFIEQTAWYKYGVQTQPKNDLEILSRGNRFTSVDKDSIKDRGICIEPSGNLFLQLSVGDVLKKRLDRAGVDLLFAQDKHRDYACTASISGTHATIDLSSASDTVSLSLVKFLLPSDWFDLCNMLRSPTTLLDNKIIHLQKFSSMGNGFTFELETLIFASLAHACGAGTFGSDFLVFGDDLIVPSHIALDLVAMLEYSGFSINSRKTFLDGPFRESCGGDFFDGNLVRAHYVKKDPISPIDWIILANGIRSLGYYNLENGFYRDYLHTAWLQCLDNIPSVIRRNRGPTTLGDLLIHDTEDRWCFKWKYSIRYFRVITPDIVTIPFDHWRPSVVYAAALYGVSSSGVTPRHEPTYKHGWVSSS